MNVRKTPTNDSLGVTCVILSFRMYQTSSSVTVKALECILEDGLLRFGVVNLSFYECQRLETFCPESFALH